MVGLTEKANPWLCYCFDRRVRLIGEWIDSEVEAERHKKNGHPQWRLDELLNNPDLKPGQRKNMSIEDLMALAGET